MNCYRFPDRQTFIALADTEGLLGGDHEPTLRSHIYDIDEVGIIVRGGTCDPETGEELMPPEVLEGWHVNTQGLAPEAWDPYLVVVNNPARVFSGGDTEVPSTDVLEEIAAS